MTTTVLLTGAGTGIGRETVSHLDARGLRVFAGVYPDAWEGVSAETDLFPGTGVETLALDVTDPASIDAARAAVERRAGRLHGLVNNAGVSLPGPLELVDSDYLRRSLEVNLVGTLAVTRAFLPALRESRGRVVNLGSVQGHLVLPYSGPYCATKAAIAALTHSLRQELAPAGVRVCLVEPGYVTSNMVWKSLEAWDRFAERIPSDRLAPYRAGIDQARKLAERLGHLGSPPAEVSAAIHHALTATRPRARYRPGRGASLESLLAAGLPTPWLDRMVRAGFGWFGREAEGE